MTVKSQWAGSLLLGHDEGDAGAVGLQRWSSVSGPAVEHGQCGQRWRSAAVASHVPQLVGVPVNGVVVVELNSAGNNTSQGINTGTLVTESVREQWTSQCTYWFVLAFLFSL